MQQNHDIHPTSSSFAVPQSPLRDRVGIVIESTTDTVDALARIREAEHAGIQQIWMKVDGAGEGVPDILTLFAAAATHTERIRLGTAIVPIYPRHPLVMAQQALAVHDLAPGRLRLGLGSSNRMVIKDWLGLEFSSPLPYLKEYVEVLRCALWEGNATYHGKFFQVACPHARSAQIPLLLSALGKKAFRLAGEIADGVLSWMCPVPYLLSSALPALHAGAESRQRPTPPVVAHLLVALSTDEEAARASVRQLVVGYAQLPFYARMFAEAGFAGAGDGKDADVNALTQTLVISGNEATVRNRVEELLASGLDELMLQLIPVASEESERKQLLHLIGSLQA